MQQPSVLSQLETRVDALISKMAGLRQNIVSLKMRIETVERENRKLRAESGRVSERSAKAKSMLETLVNQLPKG